MRASGRVTLPVTRPVTLAERVRPMLRGIGRAALWVWGPATVVLVAALMVSHVLALPTPPARSVELALARLGEAQGTRAGWRAFHVLYADCPCSRRVADSLVARGARQDISERVLFVRADGADGGDGAQAQRLRGAGFVVDPLTAEQLGERFGIAAAPAFFVVSPDGRVPYLGGYSDFKQGPAEDVRILGLVLGGARPEALPLFGCAVSRQLKASVDPLGLKSMTETTR
jgi:hypothetical protein